MTKSGEPICRHAPRERSGRAAARGRGSRYATGPRRDDGCCARHGPVVIRRSHPSRAPYLRVRRSADSSRSSELWSTVAGRSSRWHHTIITPNPIAAGCRRRAIRSSSLSEPITSGIRVPAEDAAKPPGAWLIDNQNAIDDPAALSTDPGRAAAVGRTHAGYKGFGLTLLVEALTAGLAGFGRADPHEGWGGTVFVQVLDPKAAGSMRSTANGPHGEVTRFEAASGHRARALPAGGHAPSASSARMASRSPNDRRRSGPWAEKLRVEPPQSEPIPRRSPLSRASPSSGKWRRDDARMPARSFAAAISTKPAAATTCARARLIEAMLDGERRQARCARAASTMRRIAVRPSTPDAMPARAQAGLTVARGVCIATYGGLLAIKSNTVCHVAGRSGTNPTARTRHWRCRGAAHCRAPKRARRSKCRSREPARAAARAQARARTRRSPSPGRARADPRRPALARGPARRASRFRDAGSARPATRVAAYPRIRERRSDGRPARRRGSLSEREERRRLFTGERIVGVRDEPTRPRQYMLRHDLRVERAQGPIARARRRPVRQLMA